MSKKNAKREYPATEWKKGETRPCPSGRCKHRHVKDTGPCTEIGCACSGSKKGGR